MASEDLLLAILGVAMTASIFMSIFLWFFKKQRKGRLLWVAYAIRAICSLFFFYSVVFVFEVLYGEVPVSSIMVLAVPFGLVGLLLAIPWGILLQVGSVKALKYPKVL